MFRVCRAAYDTLRADSVPNAIIITTMIITITIIIIVIIIVILIVTADEAGAVLDVISELSFEGCSELSFY